MVVVAVEVEEPGNIVSGQDTGGKVNNQVLMSLAQEDVIFLEDYLRGDTPVAVGPS